MMLDLDVHLPAIAAGDADAFGRWIAGAEGRVRESLRPYATRVDTEAVLQETLLRVWQVAPRHVADGRPNSLVRLAIRIGRNLCIDDLRRARLAPVEDEDLDETRLETFEPRAPDPLLRKVIAHCHEKLPDKPAEVLRARLASGGAEPDETLAERLGMRINTFLQNFTRARKMLAECLEKHHVDLEAELR
ncbi:sigma factor [Polyangium sp. 15x6]|nr:sigma factor [Polyangium sp. 15x6]